MSKNGNQGERGYVTPSMPQAPRPLGPNTGVTPPPMPGRPVTPPPSGNKDK